MKQSAHSSPLKCSNRGSRRVWLCCLLLALLADARLSAAGSSAWTNRAGHVLHATPLELTKTKQVVFLLPNGKTVSYPLSVFPEAEQARLRERLGEIEVPYRLRSAYAFASRAIKRSRLLMEHGSITAAQHEKNTRLVVRALRAQARELVQQGRLSMANLNRLLEDLESPDGN